jgi:peptidoglycan/LPS O-acetylase OafA/YrhL
LGFALLIATIIYLPNYAKWIRILLTKIGYEFLLFTARYSYALFLFHFLAFSITEMVLKKVLVNNSYFYLISFVLGMLVAYGSAIVITRFIDDPIQKLRKHSV